MRDFTQSDNSEIPVEFILSSIVCEASEFKPFDKVLIRDDNTDLWCCDFFSHIEEDDDGEADYITVGGYFKQCIPFEGNEHLVGKEG